MSDEEYIKNISSISTEELFNSLEYYGYDSYYSELWRATIEELKKRIEDATPIESITTKGGMTLSLKKTDIETSDLVRCIASVLKDITVEEFANKYKMLTFTDNNSGKSVSYCRVDGEEAEE